MLIVVERRETFHYYYPMGVHPPGDLTVTNDARFCKEWQKETPYRLTRYGVLWTRRESNPRPFGCEPNALPAISLLCTPYALREKKNQRIFVHIEYSASPTTFLGRKYGIQVADFQDEAIWGVIWLADK